MFTQLNPPIPVHVIGKGDGLAVGMIDYGLEHNLIWVTALDANGELWCAPNPTVRMQKNWTAGRAQSAAVSASKADLARVAEVKSGAVPEPCTACASHGEMVSA